MIIRKLIYFLVFIHFVLIPLSYCQTSWVKQDSVIGYAIYGVDFINENTGYYCGYKSRIHKTTNGGDNWIELLSSDSTSYSDVFIVDNNLVYATRFWDNLYKSTNAGNSWLMIPVTTGSNAFRSISMFDANTGFICSSVQIPATCYILKTTNGGLNWNAVCNLPNANSFFDVTHVNRDTAFVCGSNHATRTFNGGLNWSYSNMLVVGLLSTIKFVNNLTGFIGGSESPVSTHYPVILKTTNCGGNWTKIFFNYPGCNINGIDFIDEFNGLAVGDSGLVLRTTNSGYTWIRQNKLPKDLVNVCYRSVNKATIVGLYYVYATSNGGWERPVPPILIDPPNNSGYIKLTPTLTWQSVALNTAIYRIQVATDSNFSNILLNVTNLDSSWYTIKPHILNPDNIFYWRVRSENPLYSSIWSEVWKFNTNVPLAPDLISPLNNDTGVISTPLMDWSDVSSAINYKTQLARDSTFMQIVVDTNCNITQFNVPYQKLSWNSYFYWRARAYNYSGPGLWSVIWKFKTSIIRPNLIIPQNNDTGIIYDALFDWDNFPNAISYRIQFALDSLLNNLVYDNGSLSNSQYKLKRSMLQSTYYYWRVNATTATNISFWSEVRKFKTSGLFTGIKNNDKIPTEFYLYNNYPNPFNPVTNIKFDIPETEIVKLIIYNSLGQEIIQLIDEQLSAGTYEVIFDGSNFPSGIYFYRINFSDPTGRKGDYVSTKRMVLLK